MYLATAFGEWLTDSAVVGSYSEGIASYSDAVYYLLHYIYNIGEIFGAIIAGYFLCDRIGRRVSIMSGAAILLITTAIVPASTHIAMFVVFRLLQGFG